MITIQDVIAIINKSWEDMNPAQKVVMLKEVYRLKPNQQNKDNLEKEVANYNKWKLTTNYAMVFKGIIYE